MNNLRASNLSEGANGAGGQTPSNQVAGKPSPSRNNSAENLPARRMMTASGWVRPNDSNPGVTHWGLND